jgi:Flp pilus assembly protein TadD
MQPPTQPPLDSAGQPTLPPHTDPGGATAVPGSPPGVARLGEYELLEEIARGGMGVVFRARHRQLGRVVALKMILTGRLASAAEVQRFLVEAEAAAQLDHPGIVPIYEIGEHEGQHFFAMKLVEGGSLAQRLASLRNDPRAGVALVARVARAVQHAHERGILHRDLKPSNILLDADGTPLVTDFGLAKHLTGGGGQPAGSLTQSGAILGTPSYMAPEQAAGARQVTTAADVYALGAILYEVLTGRPPHVGPSPLEVLVRVLDQDPAPPRELNPRVDRDLEAICLKCLARRPGERYASAAALAADLEHWLQGEPLSLRSAALATQVRSWLRQNLRTAGRALAVGLTCGLVLGLLAWFSVNRGLAHLTAVYDQLPSVPRPWVLVTPVLPDWVLLVFSLAILVLLGGMGFATAVVVRPTTRHTAVAAGLAVGFLTAVIAFALSVGESMLMARTTPAIDEDLAILTESAFTRTAPGEPHPADRLLAKYPDPQQFPAGERAGVIRGKIFCDLLAGLITGLWWGILCALLICLVPGVTGTVMAWSLLQRHGSVMAAVFPYAELAVTVTCLTGVVVHYVLGPLAVPYIIRPEAGWLAAVLAGCGLGLLAIWRRWPVYGRLLVHVGWIALLVWFQVHEATFGTLEGQAVRLVQAGQLDEAARRFEQVLRRQPDRAFVRFETAIVCLRAGDEEAYRRHCRDLLQNARGTSDPRIADQAAKAYLLGGGRPEDLPLAADLADRAVRLGAGDSANHYFQLVRGMAAYRSGQDAEALDWLHKCQERRNAYSSSTALVFEAMALQRLGRPEEARAALGRADAMERFLLERVAGSPAGPLGPGWVDVLIFQIAREEAGKVVAPPPDTP